MIIKLPIILYLYLLKVTQDFFFGFGFNHETVSLIINENTPFC